LQLASLRSGVSSPAALSPLLKFLRAGDCCIPQGLSSRVSPCSWLRVRLECKGTLQVLDNFGMQACVPAFGKKGGSSASTLSSVVLGPAVLGPYGLFQSSRASFLS
jgi:hypothetical protein